MTTHIKQMTSNSELAWQEANVVVVLIPLLYEWGISIFYCFRIISFFVSGMTQCVVDYPILSLKK